MIGMLLKWTLVVFIFVFQTSYAAPEKEMPSWKPSWYISVDAGATWPQWPDFMTVDNGSGYPEPENLDRYSTNNPNLPELGIQLGRRWQKDQTFFPALSLAVRYQHLFREDIQGSITQYSLPDFENYDYRWNFSADLITAYSKIDLVTLGRIMPYFDVGLGVSLNHAGQFQEMAHPDVTARISPDFASLTKGQFTYNVGAGLDILLMPRVILFVGYDFQHLGRIASDSGETTWAGETLDAGSVDTNTALVGLTYVMN